jgi:3-isopropylmalate/(R)-2-methylmalate dehydratase small subunit
MTRFEELHGIAAVLLDSNIDTDALAPARFLRTSNPSLGAALLANMRYDSDDRERPEFVLNQDPFRDCSILVAGDNFGCGSSREAAVWALLQFGIRCVIAPSFGDIFFENSFKNGLLPVIVGLREHEILTNILRMDPHRTVSVSLDECLVQIAGADAIPFSITQLRRTKMLQGLSDIDLSLKYSHEIDDYEDRDRRERPWIYISLDR